MTLPQVALIAVLVGTLGLFIWGRWRHDVVAAVALLASLLLGLVKPENAFSGFSDPAVITVALVFILSAAIRSSGLSATRDPLTAAAAGAPRTCRFWCSSRSARRSPPS